MAAVFINQSTGQFEIGSDDWCKLSDRYYEVNIDVQSEWRSTE